MLPKKPQPGGQPRGSYAVVAVLVIGLAAGISATAVTGQSYWMIVGLAASALAAFWLGKRPAGS